MTTDAQRLLINEVRQHDKPYTVAARFTGLNEFVCYIQRYETYEEAVGVCNECYAAHYRAATEGREEFSCDLGDMSIYDVIAFEVAKTVDLIPADHPDDLLINEEEDTP